MNLGDLEFKAEDFAQLLYYLREECETPTATQLAELTNRLLRERLENALLLRHSNNKTEANGWYIGEKSTDTHSGRLVCIERIKK